ncbi:MAG: protein kinase [Candidatus Riflebacteria bacterium]|nr:protein kinase [Candidatus Riflebacteria bacterium]
MPERFGEYELSDRLGSGGMGSVYRALWRTQNQVVALKRLHPGLEGDVRKRFLREIEVVSQLAHPNIVRVLDFGEVGGLPYLAMEVVQGETLANRIDRRELEGRAVATIEEFYRMADGLAAALEYVHARGIVHRDLKPANVFVNRQGEVLLADFGLAHVAAASRMTASGAVIGTPAYLAPEQITGGTVDHRSDLYQAGLIFFEVLAGHIPFEDLDASYAIATARINKSIPPPSSMNPTIPATLDRIVLRCLAVEPAERYQTASELRTALAGARKGVLERPLASRRIPLAGKPATPPRPAVEPLRRVSPTAIAAVTATLVAAGAVGMLVVKSRPAPAPVTSQEAPAAPGELQIVVDPGSREALISFRTAESATGALVLEGPQGRRELVVSSTPSTHHTTWVSELTPATRYSFVLRLTTVTGKTLVSRSREFETRP